MTKAALLYTVLLGSVLLATRCYEDYRANYSEPPQWVYDVKEAQRSIGLSLRGRESWERTLDCIELSVTNLWRWCWGKPPFREWV